MLDSGGATIPVYKGRFCDWVKKIDKPCQAPAVFLHSPTSKQNHTGFLNTLYRRKPAFQCFSTQFCRACVSCGNSTFSPRLFANNNCFIPSKTPLGSLFLRVIIFRTLPLGALKCCKTSSPCISSNTMPVNESGTSLIVYPGFKA